MTNYKFTIVVERDEDGVDVASVPVNRGCYTQGETYMEENLVTGIVLTIVSFVYKPRQPSF